MIVIISLILMHNLEFKDNKYRTVNNIQLPLNERRN